MENISKSRPSNTKLLRLLSLLSVTFIWSSPVICGEKTAVKTVSNPGLVAYYSFDEGKGDLIGDLSGNGNSGRVSGEAKWVKLTDDFNVQHFGYALEMNSVVDCGKGSTLDLPGTNLTLEIWFKTAGVNRAYGLATKFSADWKTYHRGYILGVKKNNCIRLWLGFGGSAKAFDTEGILEPDTFYHVIATYDGKFVKIHLNGRMLASIPESRAVESSINDHLYLGNFGLSENDLIDQIKIFNRVLSVDEINASYAADKPRGQYKSMSDGSIGANVSPNMLINTTFARCSNPGIPDWWGTFLAASIKNWEGTYGVDESMSPPVPGVKCLRIKNPWPLGAATPRFWVGSTFTCFPGKKDYTFSVYLKAEGSGLTATIDGGTSSRKNWKTHSKFNLTTEWQRCVVSGFREDASAMASLGISIDGQGTVWIAAPQMESGLKATPYQPADTEKAGADIGTDEDLPKVECVLLETPPVLDGKLDDACWKKAGKLGNFKRTEHGSVPAQVGTEAWIACDATNLYIAFRCHEPEMNKLRATEQKQGGAVYLDDSVEIFLSTNPEANGYYQLAANSLGIRYGAFNRMSWNADWKCAAAKDRDDWTIEFAIPIASFDRSALETPWRINLCRTRYAGKEPEHSSWSPIKDASFHTPNRFAWLTGIKVAPSAVSANPKKVARPALQAMTEYDFYTDDQFAALLIDWASDSPADLELELKEARTGKILHPLEKPARVAAASTSRIQLPLGKLADGQYEITVKAMVNGQAVFTAMDSFSKLPENSVEVRTNKPGRHLTVDGKPFFAYGPCLYVQWIRWDKGGGANWQKNKIGGDNWQLDDIKSHGFNTMWVVGLDRDAQSTEAKEFLGECQRKGLKVLFPIKMARAISYAKHKELTLDLVRRFKDHPAILAWSFVDEPDLWWDKTSDRKEGDLLDLYRAIKAIDPYRPAYINWCFFGQPPFGTLEASDIVSVDRYPLRYSTLTFNPGIVSDLATDINRAANPVHKPTNFYLQFQGFWDMGREPIPAEVRWMSYVNFIKGTRSLQYFEYKPMSSRLWESMRPLGDELQKLFRLTTTPDARELANGTQGNLIYSLWRSGDSHYLLYANATTKSIVADIDLHKLTGKGAVEITPLFGSPDVKTSLPKGSPSTQDRLSLSLQPLQCGVFRLR
jgi:hypothetical protein